MAAYQGYLDRLNSVFSRLESLLVPTVAVVRGYALAGGLELMLCCDVAICADNARIGDQHANYDFMPGVGGAPRLIRRIGWQKAIYLLYSGRWSSGTEAAELGLVFKSIPAESLDHEVEVLCIEITPKSHEVLQHIKRAALAGRDLPLAAAIDQEKLELIRYLTSSGSALEGIARFLATDRAIKGRT
jgi:enoyl-CoA hydratase/carnithine racemase